MKELKPTGPDLLFLISNGFSARMICQTELLPGLVAGGLRVGVLAADRQDPSLVALAERTGVELYEYDVPRGAVKAQLFSLRRYFFNDLENNPALREKYMSRKLDASRSFLQRCQHVLSGALYAVGRRSARLRQAYWKLERRLLPSAAAEAQLADIAPAQLVCTYPVLNPEPEFMLAARRLGIPTTLQLLSWDNITGKGLFPALPDRYVVWGDVMAAELNEYYGVPGGEVYRCGVPHFDQHVRARADLRNGPVLAALGLDAGSPYLFVAMSAPRYCPREIDIVEWLAERVSRGEFGAGTQLVVRPHPQNVRGYMADQSWLPRIKALEALPGVGVLYPRMNDGSNVLFSIDQEDMHSFTHALAGAAVVLNSGSTVSIDAMMTDRPVVLTSFDADEDIEYWFSARRLKDYLHLAKLIRHGGVTVTSSYAELTAALRRYLADPALDSAERQATVRAYCVAADGGSTRRAIDNYRQTVTK